MRIHKFGHILGLILLFVPVTFAAPADRLQERLERFQDRPLDARLRPETGAIGFLRARGDAVLVQDDASLDPERRALDFLAAHGDLIGMTPTERDLLRPGGAIAARTVALGSELRVTRVDKDSLGMTHVRLGQFYKGLPVFGADVVVHMNGRGIKAVNGVFVPEINLSILPAFSESDAIVTAGMLTGKDDPTAAFVAGELAVFRVGLLRGVPGPNRLAWSIEMKGQQRYEQVWIDAQTGATLARIPLRHEARFRMVYTPQFDPQNPDLFVVRREGDPPTLIAPVDNLYDFSGNVYDFFSSVFGRDSFDNVGAIMRTVFLVNEICPNAYWDGQTTNYCPGFDVDDVVAHEWGHAYTQYTHDLIYAWQSGALNESYSDIWGEVVDLINGRDALGGNNNNSPHPAGQRWLVGEDMGTALQELLLRDMWDPERLGDPSKVSSNNYLCGTIDDDNGGVHTNSGVPNHAFAMLVDGKSFNGQTVSSIGMTKAAHVYFRAMATYQTRASNFADHDQALRASCADLIGAAVQRVAGVGTETIGSSDCAQIAAAMLAVEMSTPPTQCGYQPMLDPNTPPTCPEASSIFQEDFESGMDGWTLESNGVNPEWPDYNWTVRADLPGGRSGSAAFAFNDRGGTCQVGGDISGTFSVTTPPLTVPAGAGNLHLRFDHYVLTEPLWDGGNLKISVNGGPFTLVPQSAYQFNAPPAQLNTAGDGNTNPMAGEFAWTGTDDGENTGSWGTTIVNLASLAAPGNTVRVEFDFGIDGCNGATGWFVDNVEFYDCPAVDLQPPLQNAIADDASPDQTEGVDRDGSFVLSWSYPGTATQPCGFTIEEAVDVSPVSFQDDAEEPLVLGSNSTWSGNPQWHSEPHPDTGTIGYSVLYTDFLNTSLTMISPFSIPADAGARLSFDSFEDVEGGFDFIYVEVSADGGSSFVEVMRSSGFFSGRREIDLGSFSGQSILVRFRLTSDFVFSFPLFQGWFIDNIRIDTSVLFTEVAQVSGSIFSYNITGRGNGTYSYRIAGLFGGCDSTPFFGPYSNVRQITVDVVPTVRPTADFTMSPNPADVNETVIFDASASADNDDIGSGPEIVRYQWFFGDGTSATSTTPTTTHAYSAAGSYRVFLTVTDNDGETGSTDQLLTVIEFGDVAGSGQIRTSANQAKFAFDVSNAGGTPAGSLSYHDGGMKVASEGISSLTIDGNQATFSGPCKVNKQTGFTFEVVVTDNGSGATDTFTIRLSNGYQASGTLSKGNIEIDAQ